MVDAIKEKEIETGEAAFSEPAPETTSAFYAEEAEAPQAALSEEADLSPVPERREEPDLELDEEVQRELDARRPHRPDESPEAQKRRIRTISEKFDSNVDYKTVLKNFEGPLDLLLYLINKDEIEVKDIFVSEVTAQFLEYMKGLPYIDVDKVTEYLNIAATIIKIKAQSLVPRIDEMEDWSGYDDYEEDKAELIRAIEEYRVIKEETEKLKRLETVGYYFRGPEKNVGIAKTVYSLDGLTLDGLVKAFSALLIKRGDSFREETVQEIPRDQFTVAQKILYILNVFETRDELCFEELFTRDFTRSEIVTTFQALLELLKNQYLHVSQPEPLGPIQLRFNPESPHEWVGQKIDDYE